MDGFWPYKLGLLNSPRPLTGYRSRNRIWGYALALLLRYPLLQLVVAGNHLGPGYRESGDKNITEFLYKNLPGRYNARSACLPIMPPQISRFLTSQVVSCPDA